MITKKITNISLALISIQTVSAQQTTDSTGSKWTNHFQTTITAQKHSGFRSAYKGTHSLTDSVEPAATSLTATLFLGRKLWKGAAFYFNPEASGGKGLSFSTGVAGALNGETYRVGDVAPQVFIARAYFQQHIALGNTKYSYVEDDVNQLSGLVPDHRVTITAGKFAIADFFDDNSYSKDPRTQFSNWSLWANGAWDYPANTRGYTFGLIAELVKPSWSLRFASVAVPRIANFHLMEYRFSKAHSETIEFEQRFNIHGNPGAARVIVSHTASQAPSYQDGLQALANNNQFLLDVISGDQEHKVYGGRKTGLGINFEQQLNKNTGFFARAGWNDGKYATWAFTEIDHTLSAGFTMKGAGWKRNGDIVGIAVVTNGLSNDHRAFLKAGGYGFIIGDGTLTYGRETIIETFYNAKLNPFFWLSLDYQFVLNPGYNKDRGPVHVFGLRGHIEF